MRRLILLLLLCLAAAGCARHTYMVQLEDGQQYYADPPLYHDKSRDVYELNINGQRVIIPADQVRYIDKAQEICYKYEATSNYYCYDALYTY